MVALIPIVIKGISDVLQFLKQRQVSQSLADLWTASIGTGEWISWFATFVTDVFGAARGGEDASEQWAANARDGMVKIGDDLKAITEHTYQTVIPHSLSWLDGHIFQTGISPLRREAASMEKEIGTVTGEVNALRIWRTHKADPDLNSYVAFRGWFDKWPTDVLNTWHEWFAHPHNFALWAAPPLIGPLVSYLAAPEHKQTRDNLGLIVLDSWSEDTRTAWERLLQFMVTEQ